MRRAIMAIPALLLSACPALAVPPSAESLALAQKFGALESIQQISLSPSGNQFSLIGPAGQLQILYVGDLVAGGAPTAILKIDTSEGKLSWCRWSSDTRIVCQLAFSVKDGTDMIGYSRMIALNADGTKQQRLSARTNYRSMGTTQHGGSVLDWDVAGRPGAVLMTRDFIPESTNGTNIKNVEEGLGVEEVDTLSLKRRVVERGRPNVVHYMSDGHGAIRIMGTRASTLGGYARDRITYFYRRPGQRDWEQLGVLNEAAESAGGFQPVAVDRGRNAVFGFDDKDGTSALYSIALDGSNRRELILSRSDVDIDSLIRIGRDNRVVGASYATERRTTEYFDPELKKLSAALGKALPGQPGVSIVDASAGEAKLLLVAASDTNPGMFYLFDKATKRLEEILPVRGELKGMQLATMQSVSFPAADGTQIPGYLTLPHGSSGKGLPAIVMPHGGPGSRDEWGFDWLVQYFAARGYAVLQPNFRGSAGYGNNWYQKNGFKSWRVAIGDVNDAGHWLLKEGIAAPSKLGIVGWSYGGYAALQSSVLDSDLYKAIVAIAPVTDLERLRQESQIFVNFRLVDQYIGRGPHIEEGSPARNAARIKAPVLMFHGALDSNVGVGEARLMDERLRGAGKRVTYVEFPGLDHYLADAPARARVLSESDAHLREAFGLVP